MSSHTPRLARLAGPARERAGAAVDGTGGQRRGGGGRGRVAAPTPPAFVLRPWVSTLSPRPSLVCLTALAALGPAPARGRWPGNGGGTTGGGVGSGLTAGASGSGGARAGGRRRARRGPGLASGAAPSTPRRYRAAGFAPGRGLCQCRPPRADAALQAAYARWKTDLVTTDGAGGFLRVRRPNSGSPFNSSNSEGIGYGMIAAVYLDDQSLFDNLWKYEQLWVEPTA